VEPVPRAGYIPAVRLAALVMVVGVACGGSRSSVEVSGAVPPYPSDFTPPPALGAPPPSDPNAKGHLYLEAVYEGIRVPWTQFLEDCRLRLPPSHPLNRTSLEASVEIEIDSHGGVLDVRLTGSGDDDFDTAVTEVVRDREPFPTPPSGLLSDDGHLHLKWRFARDVRQAGVAGAEIMVIEWGVERAVPKLLGEGRIGEAARRLALEPTDRSGVPELAETVFGAAIAEAIDGPDLAARRLAVETAARMPIAQAATALRARARSSVDPVLRAATFGALVTVGEPETATVALEALAEGPTAGSTVIIAAATALDQIGAADKVRPVVAEWLRGAASGDPNALLASLYALGAVPAAELLPTVIDAIKGADARVRAAACPVYGRAAAAGTAVTWTSSAWTALAAGLKDADASVRAACAAAAGRAGAAGATDKKTASALVARLADRDLTVRAAAVVAIAKIDPGRAASELKKLATDDSPGVLAALAEAWSAMPKPPRDKLEKLAGHTEAVVRAAAVAALVRIGDTASLDAAALYAGDVGESVRLAALPAVKAESVLRELARDASPAVRAAADERLVAVLGRAATMDERLTGVAGADAGSLTRTRLAASWLLAR
jgi:TonB family protein